MKDGLVLIDKPKGITSFVAVAVVRRALGVKHCGHTGTLDPMAEGLLPVLTGRATKLSAYLLEGDKRYRAELTFGSQTDTLDAEGEVTATGGRIPEAAELAAVLEKFKGKQMQIPPMFSAIKKNGVAMYKLARKGESVELAPRDIEIYKLELLSYRDGVATLDVHCSKGTYIRSLCRDIAEQLGTYGCMTALRRTATCGFAVEDAVPLDSAEARLKAGDEQIVMPIEQALPFEKYVPPEFFGRLLSNGCAVDIKKLKGCPTQNSFVYYKDALIGIGRVLEDNTYKIVTHL